MIITNILGGLGNQMFQYAMARAITLKNKEVLKLDITEFNNYDLRDFDLDLFNITYSIATQEEISNLKYRTLNWIEILIKRKKVTFANSYYKEKYYQFDKEVLKIQKNTYLFGYWQSPKYFEDYKEVLLNDFTLKENISSSSNRCKDMIIASNSISIHIRRGDYISDQTTNDFHGTCSLTYYKDAVEAVKNSTDNPHFFIFSDDLVWAKENLDFIENITFIDLAEDIPDHEEMILMSLCKHNIIANSSFSWWGAWLNRNNEKIIIAPKQWFTDTSINTNDLIPSSWTRL